jgi:hypothetical protein
MFCDTPMVHHIRRFVHGQGCVQIILKELDSPVPGYQHTILTYSWCRMCKQVSVPCCCTISCSIISFYSSFFVGEGGLCYFGFDICLWALIYFTCCMFPLMFISNRIIYIYIIFGDVEFFIIISILLNFISI